jgi:hypothetical protein
MKNLHEAGEATREDLRLFATLAQDVHKTHLAPEATKVLLSAEPENPDYLFLHARESFIVFRWGETLAKANEILELRPTHRKTCLLRAYLSVPRPELVARLWGKMELTELADEELDRAGLQAVAL